MRDDSLSGCCVGGGSSIPWTKKFNYHYDPENLKYGQPFVYTSLDPADLTMHETHSSLDYPSAPTPDEAAFMVTSKTVASTTNTKSYSYLVFKNFDVAAPWYPGSSAPQLDSAGYYYLGPLLHYGLTSEGDYNMTAGLTVKDSYRLLCFEYQDYMDDDVAYYNTIGEVVISDILYRKTQTSYCVEIEVEDRSLQLYDMLYQKLYAEWENFIKNYYEFALEWCSYNNITDRFNDFFRDAMYKQFPVNSEKPWVRAVYYFNVWRALVFRSFNFGDQDADLERNIEEDTRLWIDKMGPDNGTLSNLEMFANLFSRLVYRFKPDAEVASYCGDGFSLLTRIFDRFLERAGMLEDWGAADSSEEADVYTDAGAEVTDVIFSNILPIDQPIYGDLALSAYNQDDIEPDLEDSGITPLTATEHVPELRMGLLDFGEILVTAGELFFGDEDPTSSWSDQKRLWVSINETDSWYRIRDDSSGVRVASTWSPTDGKTPFILKPSTFFAAQGVTRRMNKIKLGVTNSDTSDAGGSGAQHQITIMAADIASGTQWYNWNTLQVTHPSGFGSGDGGWEELEAETYSALVVSGDFPTYG
jgi:hypothetical protein